MTRAAVTLGYLRSSSKDEPSNGKDWGASYATHRETRRLINAFIVASTVVSNRPLTLREATRCRRFAPMRS